MVRFLLVDTLIHADHRCLEADDRCYFLREYTGHGAGYKHSETNNLISNLKKPMSKRGLPEWHYKGRAIEQAANELNAAVQNATNPRGFIDFTFVPMPPSKAKDDEEYDDRLLQVLVKLKGLCGLPLDIRELLFQAKSVPALHQQQSTRRSPDQVERVLRIDESCTNPAPKRILVFDDLITTGSHFVAAKRVLQRTFSVDVVGIFLARRIM